MGAQFLPRSGDEVLTTYYYAQTNTPVILGGSYNDQNEPPFSLPTQQAQSGIKTKSVGGKGSNELSLIDAPGKELFNVYAQNSFNTNINNNETVAVQTNHTVNISGDHNTYLTQGKSTFYSPKQVVIQAGQGKITMTPNSLTLEGPQVSLGLPGSPVAMPPAPIFSPGIPVSTTPPLAAPPAPVQKKKIIFLQDTPTNPFQLAASVNLINQMSIAPNSEFPYPLTDEQQNGPLNLNINGNKYEVLQSINNLTFNDKGEACVYVGTHTRKATPAEEDPKNIAKAIGNRSNNHIVANKMPSSPPSSIQIGWNDINQMTEEAINWLYAGFMNPNIVPYFSDLVDAAQSPTAREVIAGIYGKSKIKIAKIEGEFYVIFQGGRNLPKWVESVPMSVNSPSLKLIRTYSKIASKDVGQITEGLADGIKESGWGLLLVNAVDVINYFVKPNNKEEFSDLVAELIDDSIKFEIASIIVDIAGGLAIAAGMSVGLVAVGGIIAVATLGVIFDELDKANGFEECLNEMTTKCQNFVESKFENIIKAQAQQYIQQTQQEEGVALMQNAGGSGFFGFGQ